MKLVAIAGLFVSLVCLSAATQVSQCDGLDIPDLQQRVQVGSCKKPPCKLRKKTTVTIDIKFTPEKNVKNLITSVYAEVLGIPLPFVGVDGISACDKIFLTDGTTKAPCPLKGGEDYIYKNSFPILEFYPRVTLVVHWSLSENGKSLTCFEVPAKIL